MEKNQHYKRGLDEIRAARSNSRIHFMFIAIFSFFVNILMLASPLYMLQVYDRVLSSRSLETLVALTVLVGFLYIMMGILDFVRGRVLARVGLQFYENLAERVFSAMQDKTAAGFGDDQTRVAMRDLEAMQRALASPLTSAMFDIPWTPMFFLVVALFHPWLGILALIGGAVLIALALLNQWLSKKKINAANMMSATVHRSIDNVGDNAELVQGLGMKSAVFAKWRFTRKMAIDAELGAGDATGGFSASSKTFRMALQSAMLGLGAYLVLTDGLTPGVMIASSVIMGRALAPIETFISQWEVYQRSLQARDRLAELLGDAPEPQNPMDLGKPEANLSVQDLTIIPPALAPNRNKPTLRGLNFELKPGEALGVIGASGAGKSSLARALIGVWHPSSGKIELNGASLSQYDTDKLGQHIGYLPQQVTLFDGTISENIARMNAGAAPSAVIHAAKMAAVHEMILQLPKGYDTPVQIAASRLSGGQMQRIGLARAFYGEPTLLVLDEPNSNLDHDGTVALNRAILAAKDAKCAVIIMAHRPAAIQLCEKILVLENGTQRGFGPKDEILRATMQNYQSLNAKATPKDTAPSKADNAPQHIASGNSKNEKS